MTDWKIDPTGKLKIDVNLTPPYLDWLVRTLADLVAAADRFTQSPFEGEPMSTEIIPFKEARVLAGLAAKPPAVFLSDAEAAERFFGFFTANIRTKTRAGAYYKAVCRVCRQGPSKPTVKQHLAALRMPFDWLVVGHVLEHNRRTPCAARNIRRRRARRRCSTGRKRCTVQLKGDSDDAHHSLSSS